MHAPSDPKWPRSYYLALQDKYLSYLKEHPHVPKMEYSTIYLGVYIYLLVSNET